MSAMNFRFLKDEIFILTVSQNIVASVAPATSSFNGNHDAWSDDEFQKRCRYNLKKKKDGIERIQLWFVRLCKSLASTMGSYF